ncbi:OLC1v1001162C1 [Oldenlandia corymbosa var. corymbosa]|uniref:OLC1v1001162C1 n=1 Tax=Oldenlandia corymbosa var. corymbosa TaxID=529605 RepID=A0AAV1D4Z1_OLDCO|nr:OLC1v1001162C1 [Oldenlandia corymbosa var. corymbosa]
MEFTFNERLALELEEQGLTVASMLAAKAEDCGEYEDSTTLDFNTGNIKDYWWKYIIRILMHPVNKNKNKILKAMHQFYTNTAEEKQKEISDHVDLSSESYYNDRKTEGWVK